MRITLVPEDPSAPETSLPELNEKAGVMEPSAPNFSPPIGGRSKGKVTASFFSFNLPRTPSNRCAASFIRECSPSTRSKLISSAKLPTSASSPTRTKASNVGGPATSTSTPTMPKKPARASRLPKPVKPSRTYEDYFIMKKVLDEKGPSALRLLTRETGCLFPRDRNLPMHNMEHAVFTKVVTKTKTVTEYEDDKVVKRHAPRKTVRVKAPAIVVASPSSPTKPSKKPRSPCITTSTTPANTTTTHTTSRPTKSQSDSSRSPTPTTTLKRSKVAKSPRRTKKVTIVTPTQSQTQSTHEHEEPLKSTTPESHINELKEEEKKSENSLPGEVVHLPGHGNPIMELPPVRCPGDESSNNESRYAERKQKNSILKKEGGCKKCKNYKNLIHTSEDTIRYLTELLNIKEKDFSTLIDLIPAENMSRLPTSVARVSEIRKRSKLTALQFNPLCQRNVEITPPRDVSPSKGGSPSRGVSPSERGIRSRSCSSSNSRKEKVPDPASVPPKKENGNLPKFDVDEFIQKFFQHSLLTSDNIPSDKDKKEEVFRLLLAMRDAMSSEVVYRFKESFVELQRRYDALMISKDKDSWGQDTEKIQYVLDSYRRFVRYIFFYLKDSLKLIKCFERKTVSLYRNEKDCAEKQKYFRNTSMVIDGVPYAGVFIPMKPTNK